MCSCYTSIMQRIIVWTFYILVATLPLIFTPTTSELFEFPKFLILLSGTLVISAAWLIDIFINKNKPRLQIANYKLISFSILAILLTQLIAAITSIHPYTSFWGYYGRFHQGLLTTICYTILYFAATNYLDKKSTQKIIKISVYTSIIVSLYAILQRFGIDKNYWIQDVVNRPFSTLGQPNWLAAYLLPNLFLTLYLSNQKKSVPTIYYLLFTINFVTLLLTKSRSGFLAFVISYLAYWLLLIRQFSFIKIKTDLFRISSFVVLISLFVGTAFTPPLSSLIFQRQSAIISAQSGTQLESGGTESGDIRRIVWTGALKLIKKYPLFGTGPETFAYTYYWARPVEHNNTSEWDFLYNKAHNEYLNLAATTGLLGLFAYLYFHYSVFRTSLTLIPKSKKVNDSDLDSLRSYYPVLGAVIIGFAVTNFFGFSVIPVYFLVILLSALANTLSRQSTSPNYVLSTKYYVLIILPLLYTAKLFLADTNYARGKAYLDAAHPAEALPYLTRVSSSRPAEALFTSTLGEAYAQLGVADQARAHATKSFRLNPYHLNLFKSRAKIYLYLSDNESASKELETARALAPTDPKLAYNLGLVYSRLARPTEAEQQLRDAIGLKPNYQDPYYALTLLYEQSKNTAPIPALLSTARANLATYSSQLREKIDKYALQQ